MTFFFDTLRRAAFMLALSALGGCLALATYWVIRS
jgi:hypothetical protein